MHSNKRSSSDNILDNAVGPNHKGDWKLVKDDDGEETWLPTAQRMTKALRVAAASNVAILKNNISLKDSIFECDPPFMSNNDRDRILPLQNEIYNEHAQSYVNEHEVFAQSEREYRLAKAREQKQASIEKAEILREQRLKKAAEEKEALLFHFKASQVVDFTSSSCSAVNQKGAVFC